MIWWIFNNNILLLFIIWLIYQNELIKLYLCTYDFLRVFKLNIATQAGC